MGRPRAVGPPALSAGACNCGGVRAAFVSRGPCAGAPAHPASLRHARWVPCTEGPAFLLLRRPISVAL
eukprot:3248482-Alexandrium_andersonii.AAC.1